MYIIVCIQLPRSLLAVDPPAKVRYVGVLSTLYDCYLDVDCPSLTLTYHLV